MLSGETPGASACPSRTPGSDLASLTLLGPAGRRRVGDQWAEDLDELRRGGRLLLPDLSHVDRGAAPRRDQRDRRPDGCSWYRGQADHRHDHEPTTAGWRGRRALAPQIGGLHWEAGDRERARACFQQASNGLARTATRSSGPSCSRRWAGWRFAPATMLARSRGPSGLWPRRQVRGRRRPIPSAPARPLHASPGLQHAGCRPCAHGAPRRGGPDRAEHRAGQEHELLQAACRGYTNLACSTARSTRAGASRPVCGGSRPRRRSAISASSRGSMPTLPWPIAR